MSNIVKKTLKDSSSVRFSIEENSREVGRAYLYVLKNDLHKEPFGFLEDLFVAEEARGKGIGTLLVKEMLSEAKKQKCYKVICTSRESREEVHRLYQKLGFKKHGFEFRIDL